MNSIQNWWPIEIHDNEIFDLSTIRNSIKNPKEATSKKSNSVEERSKHFDIEKLKKMVKIIESFKDKNVDLKVCLMEIGNLASGITFSNDKSSIRNKYGYLKQKNRNGKGIYFEKVSQLKQIVKDNTLFSLITPSEYENLEKDLGHLQQQICHILKEERKDISDIDLSCSDNNASISYLIDVSDKYLEIFTSKLIRTELEDWKSLESKEGKINFKEKDDRYIFARLFSKIGEALKDQINTNHSNASKSNKDFIAKSFKSLLEIRDRIVHNHEMISKGNADLNEKISTIAGEIQNHLGKIIVEQVDIPGQFGINYDYEEAETFERDSKCLMKYLNKSVKGKDDVHIILQKCINEACEILKDEKITDKNKLKNKLTNVNKQYKSNLKSLNVNDLGAYPPELNVENKQTILDKYNPKLAEEKKAEKDNSKKRNLNEHVQMIRDEIEYFAFIIETKLKNKMDSLGDSQKKNELIKIMNHCEWRRQEFFDIKWDEEDVGNYQLSVKYLRDELFSLENRHFIEELLQLPEMKHCEYIIQHSMLMINQLIIEAERINTAALNQRDKSHQSQYLNKFITSPYIDDGRKACKFSRNKGLAHNLDEFDRDYFYNRIYSTLLLFDHIYSFNQIMSRDESSSELKTIIGQYEALFTTGSFKESVNWLEKILTIIESSKNEIKRHEFDQEYMKIFNKTFFTYKILELRLISLFLSLEYEEAYSKLKELVENIDLERVEDCKNEEIKEAVNFLCQCLNDYYSLIRRRYDRCQTILEQADKIFSSLSTKYKLSRIYLHLGKVNEGKEVCYGILQSNANILIKFLTIYTLIQFDRLLPNTPERTINIWYYIEEMEKIYKDNNQYFKDVFRDNYLKWNIIIITQKLYTILAESDHEGLSKDNLDKLNNIDKSFNDIMDKLFATGDIHQNKIIENTNIVYRVAQVYLLLCNGYCYVYTGDDLSLDNDGEYLNTARKYLNSCSEIQELFDRTGKNVICDLTRNSCQSVAEYLIFAYNNYVKLSFNHMTINSQIEYLLIAVELAFKYDIKHTKNYNNSFGLQYFIVAMACYRKNEGRFKAEDTKFILKCYEEAIRFFEIDTGKLKDTRNYFKFYLAYCQQDIALLQYDFRLLRNSLVCSYETLNLSDSSEQKEKFEKRTTSCKEIFDDICRVLTRLINPCDDLIKANEYTIDYCQIKLNISILRLNERIGVASIKETNKTWLTEKQRTVINTEMEFVYELIMIVEFYRVLVSKRIIIIDIK